MNPLSTKAIKYDRSTMESYGNTMESYGQSLTSKDSCKYYDTMGSHGNVNHQNITMSTQSASSKSNSYGSSHSVNKNNNIQNNNHNTNSNNQHTNNQINNTKSNNSTLNNPNNTNNTAQIYHQSIQSLNLCYSLKFDLLMAQYERVKNQLDVLKTQHQARQEQKEDSLKNDQHNQTIVQNVEQNKQSQQYTIKQEQQEQYIYVSDIDTQTDHSYQNKTLFVETYVQTDCKEQQGSRSRLKVSSKQSQQGQQSPITNNNSQSQTPNNQIQTLIHTIHHLYGQFQKDLSIKNEEIYHKTNIIERKCQEITQFNQLYSQIQSEMCQMQQSYRNLQKQYSNLQQSVKDRELTILKAKAKIGKQSQQLICLRKRVSQLETGVYMIDSTQKASSVGHQEQLEVMGDIGTTTNSHQQMSTTQQELLLSLRQGLNEHPLEQEEGLYNSGEMSMVDQLKSEMLQQDEDRDQLDEQEQENSKGTTNHVEFEEESSYEDIGISLTHLPYKQQSQLLTPQLIDQQQKQSQQFLCEQSQDNTYSNSLLKQAAQLLVNMPMRQQLSAEIFEIIQQEANNYDLSNQTNNNSQCQRDDSRLQMDDSLSQKDDSQLQKDEEPSLEVTQQSIESISTVILQNEQLLNDSIVAFNQPINSLPIDTPIKSLPLQMIQMNQQHNAHRIRKVVRGESKKKKYNKNCENMAEGWISKNINDSSSKRKDQYNRRDQDQCTIKNVSTNNSTQQKYALKNIHNNVVYSNQNVTIQSNIRPQMH